MILYFFILSSMILLLLMGDFDVVHNEMWISFFSLQAYSVNLLFLGSLLVISGSVFIFSFFYMETKKGLIGFLLLISWFIMSMVILISHSSFLTLFLGWDGLGVTSYLLVYFYSNWISTNGAMTTILTNRVGDVTMFLFLVYYYFGGISLWCFAPLFFLFISTMTKSAQFPFSSWLPLAMSAPTPVSSLVHSSTLVTAGVYLIFKYFYFLGGSFFPLVFFFGLLTSGFSSILAILEQDFKKLVALSTLSQMGFLFFSLGLGVPILSFVHMLTHAFFKSCLFLQAGVFIHFSFSHQDARFYSQSSLSAIFSTTALGVSLMSMCGILFSSGFMSKDLVISSFSFSFMYLVMMGIIFLVILMTYVYSIQMLSMISTSSSLKVFSSPQHFSLIKLFSSILITFGCAGGWVIIFNFSSPLMLISLSSKVFPLIGLVFCWSGFSLFIMNLEKFSGMMGGLSYILLGVNLFLSKGHSQSSDLVEVKFLSMINFSSMPWYFFKMVMFLFNFLLLVGLLSVVFVF